MAPATTKAGVKKISSNVPAVCDVFAARIRALRSKDQGCKNVGGVRRGNEAKRNDLAERNPGGALAPERIQTCYAQCYCFLYNSSISMILS
jgi:hypothetical protein